MDKLFHSTLHNGCNYLSILALKLIHVSKGVPEIWRSNKEIVVLLSVAFQCKEIIMNANEYLFIYWEKFSMPRVNTVCTLTLCYLMSCVCHGLLHDATCPQYQASNPVNDQLAGMTGFLVESVVSGLFSRKSSQWHHEHHGVSGHRPLKCLLNRLLGLTSKKHQMSASLALCGGNHWWIPLKRACNQGPPLLTLKAF